MSFKLIGFSGGQTAIRLNDCSALYMTDAINVEMAWVGAFSWTAHAHNGRKKMKLEWTVRRTVATSVLVCDYPPIGRRWP